MENKSLKDRMKRMEIKLSDLVNYQFKIKLRKLLKKLIEYILDTFYDDYKYFDRKLRLKKKVTIKPGKTKYVRFYAKGGNTDTDIFAFALRYKFKFNGKTYQGSVRGDSSKYKSGGEWKESFPQEESRKYNQWRWQH